MYVLYFSFFVYEKRFERMLFYISEQAASESCSAPNTVKVVPGRVLPNPAEQMNLGPYFTGVVTHHASLSVPYTQTDPPMPVLNPSDPTFSFTSGTYKDNVYQ